MTSEIPYHQTHPLLKHPALWAFGILSALPLMLSSAGIYVGYTKDIIIFDPTICLAILLFGNKNLVAFSSALAVAVSVFILSISTIVFNIGIPELYFLYLNNGILEYKYTPVIISLSAITILLLAYTKKQITSRHHLPARFYYFAIIAAVLLDLSIGRPPIGSLHINPFFFGERNLFRNESSVDLHLFKPESSYAAIKEASASGRRILVIALESFGFPEKPEIESILLKKLSTLKKSTILTQEKFSGSTIHGEFRILCGLNATKKYNLIGIIKSDIFENCLPSSNKDSIAIHGNTGAFYGRHSLYKKLGFSETLFKEDFPDSAKGCTSMYDAVCDKEIYAYINKTEARFVYFMTIDNHHPYAFKNQASDKDCEQLKAGYWRQMCYSLKNISETIIAERFDDIFVIGDHAPPGIYDAKRTTVPFVHISN